MAFVYQYAGAIARTAAQGDYATAEELYLMAKEDGHNGRTIADAANDILRHFDTETIEVEGTHEVRKPNRLTMTMETLNEDVRVVRSRFKRITPKGIVKQHDVLNIRIGGQTGQRTQAKYDPATVERYRDMVGAN